MKPPVKYTYRMMISVLICGLSLCTAPAWGQDIRIIPMETEKIEAAMRQKAAQELRTAENMAATARQKITQDRKALDRAIARLTQKARNLTEDIKTLDAKNETLIKADARLSQQLEASQGMIRELSGVIRMNAKDIDTFLSRSVLSGVYHPDTAFLKAIAQQSVFPGMDHIKKMADLLVQRIHDGRGVSLETTAIVDRTGKTVEAKVLLVGGFTAAYSVAGETGFLNDTPGEGKLFALSRLPSATLQKKIRQYMKGEREAVPMDISRGAALNQLTYKLSLWEQIPKGGPLVWPILAILAIGGLIALERLFFLLRRKIKLERVVSQIESSAAAQNWPACQETCARYAKNPVIRVIRAGLTSRKLPREEMENTVQEAILGEIPPMERFLSTMGMLAAIAPLVGLLGTVTGMIDTFHVITMHGTGDPRMMSGGISEALVTTMLGLSVAIPIMFVHTLLNREVENTVGLMEEKAVALINIIQRQQGV